jgi:Cu+-exporting ATPase
MPICGMDLVPMEPSDSEDQKTYKDLVKENENSGCIYRSYFCHCNDRNGTQQSFTKTNGCFKMELGTINIIASCSFYACWIFFVRAWKSIITWNLNMFTLIGIGTGVAFLFSLVGMFFPDIFPSEFKTEHGTVLLYFEATTVILTLFY